MRVNVFLFFLLIIIFGCSTSEESVKRNTDNYDRVKKFANEVNLKVDKNISWINVMPGTTPKFHVSGKITLLKGEDYSDSAELKYIKIYQSGNEIYYIMPKVIVDIEGEMKNIIYSTIKGLSVNKNLDKKKPVMFELIFVENKEEFRYRINNVNVEEVH